MNERLMEAPQSYWLSQQIVNGQLEELRGQDIHNMNNAQYKKILII